MKKKRSLEVILELVRDEILEIDDAITVINDLFERRYCWTYPSYTCTNPTYKVDSPSYITTITTDDNSNGLKYHTSSFTTGCTDDK